MSNETDPTSSRRIGTTSLRPAVSGLWQGTAQDRRKFPTKVGTNPAFYIHALINYTTSLLICPLLSPRSIISQYILFDFDIFLFKWINVREALEPPVVYRATPESPLHSHHLTSYPSGYRLPVTENCIHFNILIL